MSSPYWKIERRAMAKIPASTPGPKIATNNKAQINELMEREATMRNRATGRMKMALGVVLLAAKKATGTAINNPNKVPRVAMLMVSHKGHHNSFTDDQAGGIMREPMSLNCAGASATKAQIVSCVMT